MLKNKCFTFVLLSLILVVWNCMITHTYVTVETKTFIKEPILNGRNSIRQRRNDNTPPHLYANFDTIRSIYNTIAGQDSSEARPGILSNGIYLFGKSACNLFDRSLYTEYTSRGNPSLRNIFNGGINTGFYFDVLQGPSTLTGFKFCTACGNDRDVDPLTVTIEGSNSGDLTQGENWKIIYTGSTGLDNVRTGSTCGVLQQVSTSVTYKSYRFLITKKKGVSFYLSYSEVILFGYCNKGRPVGHCQPYNSTGTTVLTLSGVPVSGRIDDGFLYIVDPTFGRISQTTTSVDSTPPPYSVITVAAGLSVPNGNALVDSQGYLYVSDTRRNYVRKYLADTTTDFVLLAGTGVSGPALTQLGRPQGLAFDATESNIYVADLDNNRVLMFSVDATSGTAGILVAGGNGAGNLPNQLNSPSAIYYDAIEDYLYIANVAGYTISKWKPGALTGTIIIGTGVNSNVAPSIGIPNDVTMDQNRNLYVVDFTYTRVLTYCFGTYDNPGAVATSMLAVTYVPSSVSLDSSMNLYVTDVTNRRVWTYTR